MRLRRLLSIVKGGGHAQPEAEGNGFRFDCGHKAELCYSRTFSSFALVFRTPYSVVLNSFTSSNRFALRS